MGLIKVIVVLIAAYFFWQEYLPSGKAYKASAAQAANNSDSEEHYIEEIKYTARELDRAYAENEVATDEVLKGKLVVIKGIIQSIDKDFTDSVVLSMRTDDEYMPARISMEDSEKKAVASLRKGDLVTVQCKGVMRSFDSPSASDCTFYRPKPKKTTPEHQEPTNKSKPSELCSIMARSAGQCN